MLYELRKRYPLHKIYIVLTQFTLHLRRYLHLSRYLHDLFLLARILYYNSYFRKNNTMSKDFFVTLGARR